MTKKLALLTIIPSMLWVLAINNGYSQCDPDNGVKTVAPLYYSYTYNVPLINEQMMMLEYWMMCDIAFEKSGENCCYLEDWMLNRVSILNFDQNDLEDWMLSDKLTLEINNFEMEEWMLGFEPIVEMALYNSESLPGVEDWMLEFSTGAQQLIQDALMSIKDWMLSNSFTEDENLLDLEDWMIDGLSMH